MSEWNRPRIELQPMERIWQVVEENFSNESRTHFVERGAIVDHVDDSDVPNGYDSKISWAVSLHGALSLGSHSAQSVVYP